MVSLQALGEAMDGELLTPGAPGYDTARRPALPRFSEVHPAGVALCGSERDVVVLVDHARRNGIRVVPRAGGHCFAGRSSTEGVVLDLTRLDDVRVTPDGRARVGGGVLLARLDGALHRAGLALPTGCGATVGIAGLTLGGGIGLLGRQYGLTCDRLLGARVVLAGGRVVDCSESVEPDLFWALRGAGGGQFGVVTSFLFATVPEPRLTRFELRWPSASALDVISAWQDWAPVAPDHITANLSVTCLPSREPEVVLSGAARDTPRAVTGLDDWMAETTIPASASQQVLGWHALKSALRTTNSLDAGTMVSRSHFTTEPLPRAVVWNLLTEIAEMPPSRRELAFTPMGGAYNRVPVDHTAFAHRRESFLLQHIARPGDPWVDRSWTIVQPFATGGVYPNFPDPDLADAATAYHRGNLDRLHALKRHYDPDRLFDFPQAV